jgi:Bacterial protein of unknown function (HtrL_YibB)
MMRLTRADIEKVNLEPLRPFAGEIEEFFSPKQHYRLLAHLSQRVPGPIVDIGTHLGDSALALSVGGHPVESFDVVDNVKGRALPSNIHRHQVDLWSQGGRATWKKTLLESSIIFLDIDPHEGTREIEFVRWLENEHYRGLIVLDDIWYFKPMRDRCWSQIGGRFKSDVTPLGHWSGTGIVSFNQRVQVEGEADTKNWTLVTGYFDLTQKSDANDAIRSRPASYYIDEHGDGTLGLDQNLLVFCDRGLEDKLWSKRPKHLHSRTRIIPMAFEDFPLTRHIAKVVQNRGGDSCPVAPRATASYYLFCMARYAMLKLAIRDNPFQSTHFAWINICIERYGFQNLIHLNESLGVQREKFSTCFIDYVPKTLTDNLEAYFGGRRECFGRCSMCSGFFTGGAKFMKEVCDRLEVEFLRCLEAGYGHADEQLFPLVYFARPDLFDWYVGDYAEMITNYAHVYDRVEQPIRNLIRNSLAAGDRDVCARACDIVWHSLETGKCSLTANPGRAVHDNRPQLTDQDLGTFLRAKLESR